MKTLKVFLCFSLCVFSFSLCEGQSWLWGKQGTTDADVYGTAVDNNNNAFITGYFKDSIYFGGHRLIGNVNYIGPHEENSYLVKYNTLGNILWARQSFPASWASWSIAITVATDSAGNSIMVGSFGDTNTFGSDTLRSNTHWWEAFVTKYDINGNVQWARQSVSPSMVCGARAQSVATDNAGNIFVAGEFRDTVSFGPFMLIAELSGSSPTLQSTFLVKYDKNGNVIWARQSLTRGENIELGLATDITGNAYITGWSNDSTIFGADTLKTRAPDNAFLVKYSSGGNVIWAREPRYASRTCSSYGCGIVIDSTGHCYWTGYFVDTISFGSTVLKEPYSSASFLVKYDSMGHLNWAKQSSRYWNGYSLAKDKYDHIYLSGGGATLSYDTLIFSGSKFTISNSSDASFILKLDTAGNVICGTTISSGGDDNNTVAVSPSGNYVYLGGDFIDSLTVGPSVLRTKGIPEVPFLALWQPCGVTEDAVSQLTKDNDELKVFPNPNKGAFTLQVKSEELRVKSKVDIYNVLGEKVYSANYSLSTNHYSLDLTSQPNGIYLYRVLNEDGSVLGSGKVVIEK